MAEKAQEEKADDSSPAAEEADEETVADPNVAVAFSLGWQMARLYRTASARVELEPDPEGRLPGARDLQAGIRTEISLAEVDAALHRLGPSLELAGVTAPTTSRLHVSFSTDAALQLRPEIYRLHVGVLGRLIAADFRLGKAYGLGRALADTARIDSWEAMRHRLSFNRTAGLQESLTDLGSAFPPHAARAVSLNLEDWRRCVAARDPRHWAIEGREVRDSLGLQGHLWRALLSGEKRGTDMLDIDDYVDAGDRLLDRSQAVVRAFRSRFPLVGPAVLILLLTAIALPAAVNEAGAVAAGIAAAAAALGITWKGVGSVLASLAGKLRTPLWGAEVDQAIAIAISRVPYPDQSEAIPIAPSGPQHAYRERA